MTRKEISTERGVNTRVRFKPENGTTYDVVFVSLPDDATLFGLCWVNPVGGPQGRFYRFQRSDRLGGIMHYAYFMEKMDCSAADAAALLVLVHEEVNRTVVLPPGYDERGKYTGNDVSLQLNRKSQEERLRYLNDTPYGIGG